MVKFTYEPLNNGMYAGHGLVLLSCTKPLDLGSVSHQEKGKHMYIDKCDKYDYCGICRNFFHLDRQLPSFQTCL